MNAREFFDLVSEMRTEQKLYFQTRGSHHLTESKRLEREVDKEISRVRQVLSGDPSAPRPQSLFDNQNNTTE